MAIFTQAQHDLLVKAIAEGVLTVQYEDRRTTYRSLDEMLRLLSLMERDLGLSSGAASVIKASHDKEIR